MRVLFEGKKGTKQLQPLPEDRGFEDNSRPTAPDFSPQIQSQLDRFYDAGDPSALWDGLPQNISEPNMAESLNPWIENSQDVIDRGVVSEELATKLFDTYVKDLAPHSPFVVFPLVTTANSVRRTKPLLFLAIIAAAAGKTDPSLFSRLSCEVLSAYTHRTIVKSEKSVELVAAMIVFVTWYYPPGKFAQLKFYEHIHAAANMAMDIGLGTNPQVKRSRRGAVDTLPPPNQSSESTYEDLERKRTYLGCYIMTTGYVLNLSSTKDS